MLSGGSEGGGSGSQIAACFFMMHDGNSAHGHWIPFGFTNGSKFSRPESRGHCATHRFSVKSFSFFFFFNHLAWNVKPKCKVSNLI